MRKLKGKDLISINDLSKKEVLEIFKLTKFMKIRHKKGKDNLFLKGKSLAMIFAKPSTRTRVSFESGMTQLGGHALDLSRGLQFLSGRESLADTGAVLSKYVDGIMARLYAHENLIKLAEAATVPVINGLTDLLHPCQALSDLYTIKEKKGLKRIKLAFVGDGSDNVCHSLMHACYKLGVNMSVGCPKGYEPRSEIIQNTKHKIQIIESAKAAVNNADVVYTDTWVSMGQEYQSKYKIKALRPYQVNIKLLSYAKPDAIVMHCLPAHRGYEITNQVIDGPHSVVLDQAENRLHVQKAILTLLLK